MTSIKNIMRALASVVLCSCAAKAADYAVVVHPSNTQKLSKAEIAKIFLIKTRNYPNSKKAIPLARESNSAIMKAFTKSFLHKNASRLRAYYLKLLFTGKGKAPKVAATDKQVKAEIASKPETIGIVKRSAIDDSVRVVCEF